MFGGDKIMCKICRLMVIAAENETFVDRLLQALKKKM